MDAPTPDEIRERSPLLADRFPKPTAPVEDKELAVWIEDAAALVSSLTCRPIGIPDGEVPEGMEEVPTHLKSLAKRAVAMKIERLVLQFGSKRERQSGGAFNLRGFRAGSYAEDYFGPEEAIKAKRLDPDQNTAEVLWALATEACREAWEAFWDPENAQQPASAVRAFDWSQRPGSY